MSFPVFYSLPVTLCINGETVIQCYFKIYQTLQISIEQRYGSERRTALPARRGRPAASHSYHSAGAQRPWAHIRSLLKDVDMDTFSNRAVVGNPDLMHDYNYGKHISGITEVSTQSDSYNMDTIQVFVAYAHTTMTVDISWDISLGVDIADSSISFSLSPDVSQEMMAEGNHTFHYYDRYTWTA